MWQKYVTNNFSFTKSDTQYNRVYFINTMIFALIVMFVIFIGINVFITHLLLTALIQGVMILYFMWISLYFKKTNNISNSAIMVNIGTLIVLLTFFHSVGHDLYSFYWLSVYPAVAFFLNGKRLGLIFTLLFYGYMTFFMAMNLGIWEAAEFKIGSIFNITFGSLSVIILVWYYENSLNKAYEGIVESKHTIEEEKRIVEQKSTELSKAVAEKEMLYRELSHRVKNNLHMITSLLNLQSMNVNKEAAQALKTAQDRIFTVENMYSLLYQYENIGSLDTKEYFFKLIEEIQKAYSDKEAVFNVTIEATMNITTSLYCGIIVNELITNSLKYAKANPLQIDISLKKEGDTLVLHVADNGQGYDEVKEGLGAILVNDLSRHQLLDGELIQSTDKGVDTTIRFKDINDEED